MTISDLFERDPTRQLEEVKKINSRERAETDVTEFHETDSARRVLMELGDLIQTYPSEAARFLYIHATFGSGKTHLLKLVGLLADDESEFAYLGDQLAEQWPGFDELQQSITDSHVDRLKPVFLNLLDRDASKEPPLPFLIFEAIGRELGYPTDPNWLLEWVWRVDMEYDGIWESLQELEHDGRTFDEVLGERARIRSWLYDALPAMAETTGTDLDSSAGVKASIETAEDEVEPEGFAPEDLVSRVETVTEALNGGSKRTELLLGLDEVALFVGDSRHRYREFEETMEALQRGPNPVVVTTGQYSLPYTREALIGEPPADHWTHRQVPLEGADTEIIVRKRWLRKSDHGEERVKSLLATIPDLSLETYSSVASADPDPVESYPFREYDLPLLRTVMQELITQGRSTDHEYIQGRALLVLVRSLFTKFGWASKSEGSLVTWDVLFDLLVEETTYLPLWVQEMIDNTLVPTFDGEDAWEVRLAKGLYLLNQVPAVPSTPENLGRLMIDDVTGFVDDVVERTESGLETLVDKQKALTETNDEGDHVYTLVSEEQESILSRAQDKAAKISPHQLSAWLETRLRENDDFFRSDGSRHEVDIGEERLVPLRYGYSILEPVDRAPSPEYDSLRVRVLADDPDTVSEQVETWQDVNHGRDGGEHVLITIEVPETTLERIRNVIGMGQVLDEETESHEELEREHRADKRRLESSVNEILEDASVYTVHEHRGARSSVLEDVIADQVNTVFGSSRRTLSRPLVEVDDAKAMATFFRGSGEWPLSDVDATMLGVDTDSATIADYGWCREFIDTYESQKAVDVETLLQQTRTANGKYRGTPQESIAALLITLATSNESVALKLDTEYMTAADSAAIGRQVRTKGGLQSLQVRFDVDIVDPPTVKQFVTAVLDEEPSGEGPDEWLRELGQAVARNSATVKRTLKGADREFGVTPDAFEATIDPALSGEELSTSDLGGEEDLDRLLEEARTFAAARELFGVEDDGTTLWERFSESLDTMTSLYPNATITSRMRTTADSDTVPSAATVRSRIEDAEGHRVDEISAQHHRITGDQALGSDPDAIREELRTWLQSNEDDVRTVVGKATEEFDDIVSSDLQDVFETAWAGEIPPEGDIVDLGAVQQAKTYEQVRTLFDDTDGVSLWAQLQEAGQELRAEHSNSPTTESVQTVLDGSHPPTEARVVQLLEEAKDPKVEEADGEAWAELQQIAGRLRQELPNAEITDDVTDVVDVGERPTEERAAELLSRVRTVLERAETVNGRLDALDDGDIVLIDTRESEGRDTGSTGF